MGMSATHELGHSLGLSHSEVKDSMMSPFYRGYDPFVELHDDDVQGIQALYGKKVSIVNKQELPKTVPTTKDPVTFFPTKSSTYETSVITTPITTPKPTSVTTKVARRGTINNADLCNSARIDTIVTTRDDSTFVFQGKFYWKLTDTSVELGYPRTISEDWGAMEEELDAAFTWTNGKTYFFKGSKYWRFTNVGILDEGYPRNFSKAFRGIPLNVDAAMVWPGNDKIYFFKDDSYWKFDPEKNPSVDNSYPRPLARWKGLPRSLDAALQYSNGKSYFFKAGKYFRFDDVRGSIDETAVPGYPRNTGEWWFGCKQKNAPQIKA